MSKNKYLQEISDGILLTINVKPNSRQQELIIDTDENCATILVKSPPDKGKANKEIIKMLAKILDVSSSKITIVAGHTSRTKKIAIRTTNIAKINRSFPSSSNCE